MLYERAIVCLNSQIDFDGPRRATIIVISWYDGPFHVFRGARLISLGINIMIMACDHPENWRSSGVRGDFDFTLFLTPLPLALETSAI